MDYCNEDKAEISEHVGEGDFEPLEIWYIRSFDGEGGEGRPIWIRVLEIVSDYDSEGVALGIGSMIILSILPNPSFNNTSSMVPCLLSESFGPQSIASFYPYNINCPILIRFHKMATKRINLTSKKKFLWNHCGNCIFIILMVLL